MFLIFLKNRWWQSRIFTVCVIKKLNVQEERTICAYFKAAFHRIFLNQNLCFRYEIAQLFSEMDMTTMDETAKPSDTKKTVMLANSLNSIAGFTARSVELFKKIAELSLLKSTLEVDMKTQADTIKFLNEVLCCELDNIRLQFEQKTETKEEVDRLYLETSNAISYLQETLYFFVPILKWIVVKTSKG